MYGREHYTQASRFLTEIPGEFIEEVRPARLSRPLFRSNSGDASSDNGFNGLKPGRQVRHKKFGEGMVVSLEGHGAHARVQVNFTDAGPKWLICAYANLEPI